ncbi:glycosyltransferase [Patescibacteria group bacterium]|nr:glycosyltransferase [Patescibacteria group bacterium]
MKISLVLPTYNEEKLIGQTIDQIFDFCQKNLTRDQWLIIVADNGSTDQTMEIIKKKKNIYPNLKYFHLPDPGKGAAIKKAWQNYPAEVNIFMDADLSTDLKFIPLLIKAILNEKYELAVGSRYAKTSQLQRSFLRSLLSQGYNLILKIFFQLKVSDVHCGFKAVSSKMVQEIIPQIKNNGLFFDTELLALTSHHHFSIKEIPVNWQEQADRKTKIKLVDTALNYLKEIIKLKWRLK